MHFWCIQCMVRCWLVFKAYENIDITETAVFSHARVNIAVTVPSGAHCQAGIWIWTGPAVFPVFLLLSSSVFSTGVAMETRFGFPKEKASSAKQRHSSLTLPLSPFFSHVNAVCLDSKERPLVLVRFLVSVKKWEKALLIRGYCESLIFSFRI